MTSRIGTSLALALALVLGSQQEGSAQEKKEDMTCEGCSNRCKKRSDWPLRCIEERCKAYPPRKNTKK